MNLLNRILLVVPALLIFSLQGIGQQVSFSHFDVADRLFQNSVIAITQDAKGYMWFRYPAGAQQIRFPEIHYL